MVPRISLFLLAALALVAPRMAQAGAVFEIREAIPSNASDYKYMFTDVSDIAGLGSIARSGKEGAGLAFKTSAIPMAIYTLRKCTAVAPHIHPNGAEMLYVLDGAIRISQFRGEEDAPNVRTTDVSAGGAGYIQQGSIHFVENIHNGKTRYLQLFDHPQAGTVFVAQAMVNLPHSVVNSAFSKDVLPSSGVAAHTAAIIPVRDCPYRKKCVRHKN